MKIKPCFLGIDLGTTGLRCILSDENGNIITSHSAGVEMSFVKSSIDACSEQNPEEWDKPLYEVLKKALSCNKKYLLKAITVDSTSGTIIPIDKNGKPLYNALLHNDIRAKDESAFIIKETGLDVKPSFALSKILWIKRNMPDLFDRTYKFIHAADYLKGLISGDFETTDFSNAVKTGYDLFAFRWPESIQSKLGIPLEKLPGVVKTGEVISELREGLKKEYNIYENVKIVAGATDSTTGFYSSGASRIGDWNTTLGTVLGIKGIAKKFVKDPDGLLYSHRHPEGYWLPGAASNTGGESLRLFFGKNLKEYDKKIEGLKPTKGLVYPLVRKSEKFPFLNLNAKGFISMDLKDPVFMFKGFLEGISFVERMIYERIENIGYRVGDKIFCMGGGAYSNPWLKMRANILKKNICRAKIVETAFGSSIIAAGGTYYNSLSDAINNMVRLDSLIEPDDEECKIYDDIYEDFISECRKRNLF